jgi:hypothetical protein
LFYLDASNKLTAVPVRTSGPTFVHGRPTRVSETSYVSPHPGRHYDELPDGRLLVIKTAIDADPNATPEHFAYHRRTFGITSEKAVVVDFACNFCHEGVPGEGKTWSDGSAL